MCTYTNLYVVLTHSWIHKARTKKQDSSQEGDDYTDEDFEEEMSQEQEYEGYSDRNDEEESYENDEENAMMDEEGSYENDEEMITKKENSHKLAKPVHVRCKVIGSEIEVTWKHSDIENKTVGYYIQVQEKALTEMTLKPLDFVHVEEKKRIARIRGFKPMSTIKWL